MTPRPGRARRILKRTLQILAGVVALAVVLVLAAGFWLRGEIRGSLPQLDGEIPVPGLSAPVVIERDDLGIPTIAAGSYVDVAFGLGFVHAQDRFFQMELLRRTAAGELAELFGPGVLSIDRRNRVHRLRARAGEILAASPPTERRILDAYAQGVNAGLASLDAEPCEYLLLRTDPEPWKPEDSVLVTLAMFLELQDENGRNESRMGLMRDVLPGPLFDFLATPGTEWDAPVEGEPFATPPIPGPHVVDIRTLAPWAPLRRPEPSGDRVSASGPQRSGPRFLSTSDHLRGSNNWAVAGSETAHGGALLANDMHLGLQMPNTWYRVSLVWGEPGTGQQRITGPTLPGGPAVAVGSNGHIAWGYTNSYADWTDVVIVETVPGDDDRYLAPEGPREFDRRTEILRANTCVGRMLCDGVTEAETLEVVSTIWGPIVGEDHRGRRRAVRWVGHEPAAVNLGVIRLATARHLDEAMEIANRAGMPGQNFVVADSSGRIGWTIMGVLPRRVGFDGRLPGSWADGTRRWDGWLDPSEYPRIVDPPHGRIWTANARVVGGEALANIGDGGYALGARARQIRDDLFDIERASERDMLAIQLDDRAVFLERWRDLLLELLDPAAITEHDQRRELRRLVEETWTGHASIDSAGFRLVRAFRQFASNEIFETITVPCKQADPDFFYHYFRGEGPLWKLVTERPMHFLHPAFETWEDWLLSIVDFTIDYYMQQEGAVLSEQTWGARNTVRISHPLSQAVPFLGRWLDVAPEPLPGDNHMPRVQELRGGVSQRMVISPGRETDGIFHMPGGQSGHFLSPHYRDGHRAWVEGSPTPFLPGAPVHTLRLQPR
ncbi:MAG: penicillin acylase family protein [Planctomycetota bacterium]|jgi:penicillin amidase